MLNLRVVLAVLVALAGFPAGRLLAQEAADPRREAWEAQLQEAAQEVATRAQATDGAEVAVREAWEQRRDRLRDALRLQAVVQRIGDPATLQARYEQRERERQALQESTPPPVGPIASEAELEEFQRARDDAQAALTEADTALERARQLRADAKTERTAVAVRRSEIEKERAALAGSEEPGAAVRLGTLEIELAALDLREQLESMQPSPLPIVVSFAETDKAIAEIRFRRAEQALTTARERWAEQQKIEAERKRVEAERLAARAREAEDPLKGFLLDAQAEATRAEVGRDEAKTRFLELERRYEVGERSLKRVREDRQRLARRLELTEGVSDRVANLLIATIERSTRIRRFLETQTRPQLFGEIEENRAALTEVQDRLWDLQAPDEENPVLRELIERVGREREAEARRAFREATGGAEGLIQALLDQQARLEDVDRILNDLEQQTVQRIEANEQLYGFAQSSVYWVRSAAPISLEVLGRGLREIRTIPARVAERRSLEAAHRSFERSPVSFVAIGLLFLASLAVAGRLVPLLRRARSRLGEGRGRAATLAIAITMALVLSAPVPLVLLLAGRLLSLLELPATYGDPAQMALGGLAFFWFVRALASRFLRADGIGVELMRLDAPLATQIHRSVRILLAGYVLFHLPSEILAGAPFGFTVVPRLLFTAFLMSTAIAEILLIRRDGALVRTWTRGRGVLYRAWGLLGPLISLGLLGLVAMDAFGYRVGARVLMRNVGLTVVAAILLRGLYGLTTVMVETVTRRVHRRIAQEEGARAAWEASSAVMQQLTRFVSLTILVVTALLLADFWGIGNALESSLRAVVLAQIDENTALTLWEVLLALCWIVGTHVVLRNLAGLFEFLVFPLVGESAANRYVILAISRYALFVIGYAAALLTLRFPFSSLGWIVAAASVGLGFGLQEIVANFISGLILLIERPVRVGDTITVGATGGVVDKITIRATVVTNWDLQEIVIPNKNFITSEVINWTLNHNVMRRKVLVGVSYGSDVEQVLRVLREEVDRHPKVLKDPAPRVLFEGFGNSSLDFEIWAFTQIQDGKQAMSDLRGAIHRRFREEGIEIPFPQRDLHLRTVDGEAVRGLRGESAAEPASESPEEVA